MKQLRRHLGHREPGQRTRLAAVGLLCALAMAGCGSSTVANTSAHTKLVKTSVKQAIPPKVAVPASVRKQLQAEHNRVLAALHGPPPAGSKTPGIPAYLRQKTHWVNRAVTATLARPRLTIAGDTVIGALPDARAKLTVVGPIGEAKYAGTRYPQIPGSFQVRITAIQGALELEPADFTIFEVNGEHVIPVVTAADGGDPPSVVPAGRSVTLRLTATLLVGDDALVFSPVDAVDGGHKTLAGWDFVVEDD